MASKYKRTISLCWIFKLIATLDTINQSYVEGLQTLDKNNYAPKPKGTIKTIEVPEDSDIIDCVDIYKQPTFNDPRIKDIQMKPSLSFLRLFNKTNERRPKLIQNWHKYGECPKGTIPIRRPWIHNATDHRHITNNNPAEHEYASTYQFPEGRTYHGAGATFDVWNPQIGGGNEFSLSQLWVSSGRHVPPINTIEAGWIVYPTYFHGPQTRLFIFWTANNYKKGCYNHECMGFMQTNHQYALGAGIAPTSMYGRESYGIHINVARDSETKRWWLQVQDTQLGYFAPEFFTSLPDGADHKVAFGGEITNKKTGNRHTNTQMGSGHFSTEGYKKASFVRNAVVVNDRYDVEDASLDDIVTNPRCYDLVFGPPETTWKTHFYFGGPGLSRQCP